MKRRDFLKTIVSVAGAALVAPDIEFALAGVEDMYSFPAEAALAYDLSESYFAPRGLSFVINESTEWFPELVPDLEENS